MSFVTETPTRWSSSLNSLVRLLYNHAAMVAEHARSPHTLPDNFIEAERKEAVHACSVYRAFRIGTRLSEDALEKGVCSVYLPSYQAILDILAPPRGEPQRMAVPSEIAESCGQFINIKDLLPMAERLRVWLRADLELTKRKHLEGTTGLCLLQVAAYLDPRFKQAKYAGIVNTTGTRAEIKKLAVQRTEAYPGVVEALRISAADPDGVALGAVAAAAAPAPKKQRRERVAKPKTKATAKRSATLSNAVSAPVQAELAEISAKAASQAGPARALARVGSDEAALYGAIVRAEDFAAPGALVDIAQQVDNQLSMYDLVPLQRDMDCGPLSFWKDHAQEMPYLAAVAQHVFSVPASTVVVERLFSAAGRAVTRRRPRLSAMRAANTILGHANVSRGVTGKRVWRKRMQS